MKLSTKGRYGVKAMLELALRYGEGPIALKTIASRQNISDHYLEQLMGVLRKAGLVNSVRGAQGGYELSRKPDKIKIGDIVRVLEGPIAPVECVSDAEIPTNVCERAESCVTRILWGKVKDAISDVLDSTTLFDLCEEVKAKELKEYYMYYI